MDPSQNASRVPHFRSPLPVDAARALTRVNEAAGRVADAIRAIPDPHAPTRGLQWTLGETATHLCTTIRLYMDCLEGRIAPEPRLVADLPSFVERMNHERLEAFPERGPAVLAERLLQDVARFLQILNARDPSVPVVFPAGYSIDGATQACFALAELLVHGRDITRSLRRAWPITPDDAALVVSGVIAVLPLSVDPARIGRTRATIQVRLRGNGCYAMQLDRGKLRVTPCDARADLYVSMDPVTALLAGYGRLPSIIPALTGKAVTWGRKPWLALGLPRMFRTG